MKKYAIMATVALTASFAVASSTIDFKQVNKVIDQVVQSELTGLINKGSMKLDENSNLENVQTLNVGANISATANASKWSSKPTSLDARLAVKTLTSDEQNTALEVEGAIGSKTDAVPLYAYAASELAKELASQPNPTENDKLELALLMEATQTTTLDAIPSQLTRALALAKKELSEDQSDPQNVEELAILENLRVETLNDGSVVLGAKDPISLDDIKVSKLALHISSEGINLTAKVSFGVSTEMVQSFMEQAKQMLATIQNADEDMLNSLRAMAKDYISFAEKFVKGE